MTAAISCPQCLQPVDPQARFCEHCGVDLALAAAVAEQWVLPLSLEESLLPLAPEVLVPRLGDHLLEGGVLQPEDLQRALAHQRDAVRQGRALLLGQALIELGIINQATLDQAITTQILHLQQALNETNHQLEQRVQERTQDLQQALDRLAELNQLKANFIANISHELRTPLTHIKGYLDLLGEHGLGPLNDQQDDAMRVLRRAEARLERLIEDLIQFSLASRGELTLKIQRSQLPEVVQLMVNRSQGKARQAGVHLSCIVPADLPAVEVDEEKIGWVLSHLIDNAIKFTPAGGRVEVGAQPEGSMVVLAVSDTGIGIPAERLQEIFEPFHQLDSSATRRYGGTGLGLTMVKRIVEAHGAQVKVQSVLGRGSRFEFAIPQARIREMQ
jgi:signal transduction histidine kinase